MAFLSIQKLTLYVQTVLALKPGPLPTLCSRRLVDQGPLQGPGPQFAQTRLFKQHAVCVQVSLWRRAVSSQCSACVLLRALCTVRTELGFCGHFAGTWGLGAKFIKGAAAGSWWAGSDGWPSFSFPLLLAGRRGGQSWLLMDVSLAAALKGGQGWGRESEFSLRNRPPCSLACRRGLAGS